MIIEGSGKRAMKTTKELKRKNNYDMLKVVSSICVVIIHANWIFFENKYELPTNDYIWIAEAMINIITRFSVPAFLMISGAFVLKKQIEKDPIVFYIASFHRIFFPSLICLFLLVVVNILRNIVADDRWYGGLMGIVRGGFSNMWYFYMLVGVYFMAPVIRIFKVNVKAELYYLFAVVFLGWAMISQMVTLEKVAYSIGVSVAYLAYFIIGDVVTEVLAGIDKNHYQLIRLIITAVSIVCICITYVARRLGINYYAYKAYVAFFSPTIIIYSVSVFILFGTIDISINSSWLAKRNIYIYAFHTAIMDFVYLPLKNMISNELIFIVMISVITYGLAVLIAIVMYKIVPQIGSKR